ncbi:hypothetical protein VTJ04DRAFT_7788 [Mycothermus thermophilus]|uniref:uncharacterized protein n=1 Tax=Humicola insolens TaxID=85995 RepID=UPI003743A9FF
MINDPRIKPFTKGGFSMITMDWSTRRREYGTTGYASTNQSLFHEDALIYYTVQTIHASSMSIPCQILQAKRTRNKLNRASRPSHADERQKQKQPNETTRHQT